MATRVKEAVFSAAVCQRRYVRRCNSCAKRGRMHHLTMPKATLRYPETVAKVRRSDIWLCDACYEKLREAIENEGYEHEKD